MPSAMIDARPDEKQRDLDEANARFWDELCGTALAKAIGINDQSHESLKKFDDAYFAMYPYLLPIVRPEEMEGKSVLEIGLGYGSLSQKLAEAGADYTGIDIAARPVEMVNARLGISGLPGRAIQGNALEMPFDDESFDFLVSIGCFHHTGNVQRCLDETYRVLKPGGRCVVMLYNKYSFRQWHARPWTTFREFIRSLFVSVRRLEDDSLRGEYDRHVDGEAAPEVTLHSKHELRRRFHRFRSVRIQTQNCDSLLILHYKGNLRDRVVLKLGPKIKKKLYEWIPRERLLSTIGRRLGLDLYVRAQK